MDGWGNSDFPADAGSGNPGDGDFGGGDRTCNHCGKEGHVKRECPDLPEDQRGPGNCFQCGKPGHNKADCPEPQLCRHCQEEGHIARDCPTKPPETCRNCGQEGHHLRECKNNRKVDNDNVPSMHPDEAWKKIEKAAKERDLDDLRAAIAIYVKAVPDTTYQQLEKALRRENLGIFIIAYENDVKDVHTLMNLQGELNKKYTIGYFFSANAPRHTMKEGWPSSPDENIERLADAGVPVDRGLPKCNRCGEVGHTVKVCKEERVERADNGEPRCYNCDELGHRPRDCPKPRPNRFECKNCGQEGHISKECTEPRSAANVECKNCNQMGHFSRDCPDRKPMLCNNCGEEGHKRSDCINPANPAMMICRNCDEKGHSAKECPKPRDYSRITCQNCGEKGHTKIRCKQPVKEDDDTGGGFGDGGDWNADSKGFGGGDDDADDTGNGGGFAPPTADAYGGFTDW